MAGIPASLKVDFSFTVTLDQKEFSLVCRCLAGHEIRPDEEPLLLALNVRLLALRKGQIQTYLSSSEKALKRAVEEERELLKELEKDNQVTTNAV